MKRSDPGLLHHVAANVRAARHARGWSQQTLAEVADVSRRMLVAIEAGEANVSLATLDRLAAAMGISFAEIVREPAGEAAAAPVEVWRGERPESRARLLRSVPSRGGVVELWEWSLAPGERYQAEPDRPGTRELIYVVSGTLTLEVEDRPGRVEEGDSVEFPSDRPYAFANDGDEPVRFTMTVI
ncbi:MAG TPA: XRE family transcriptional regulator [Longimicrobium sp.]|nr:XRE family transcriptional regulator [Longimicrobium sp.]